MYVQYLTFGRTSVVVKIILPRTISNIEVSGNNKRIWIYSKVY